MLSAPALANPFDKIDFAAGATIVVAVSGGSDSTALLHFLKDHLDRSAARLRIIAATVDHRLRESSAAEARVVAEKCRALEIEHHVLEWTEAKPSTGLQNAARLARHALLAGLAEKSGATAVLVGHTRDDQAETVIMRSQRGEGPGLAGIASATLFQRKVWFVRPLLGLSRAALGDWLTDHGIGWADDPSNDNADFERVAIRQTLAAAPDRPARIEKAVALAAAAGRQRTAVAGRAADLLRAHAAAEAPQSFRIARVALERDADAALHALRILLAAAGGVEMLPDLARSRELLKALTGARPRQRFSLSRAVVEVAAKSVAIRRERRRGASVETDAWPAPWGLFLPSFEIEPAVALAALTGGPIPAPLPWPLG